MTARPSTPSVHVYRGTNPQYAARVRRKGERRWTIVSKWRPSKERAQRALVKAFCDQQWARGELLWITDYYDPTVIETLERRTR